MIASINNDTKKVKLISVYRDTFLNVKEETYSKINSAYSYGGPTGAIAALNKNLNLDIVNYVSVDFGALVEAIDLLDGIELTLTDQEVQIMNDNYIDGINGRGAAQASLAAAALILWTACRRWRTVGSATRRETTLSVPSVRGRCLRR